VGGFAFAWFGDIKVVGGFLSSFSLDVLTGLASGGVVDPKTFAKRSRDDPD
jgi:hypothetical protein